jgi:hypothetical protein
MRPKIPEEHLDNSEGKIAVHNNVARHRAQKSGENGFRVWLDDPHENYVECFFGSRPDLKTHYQVRAHYEADK